MMHDALINYCAHVSSDMPKGSSSPACTYDAYLWLYLSSEIAVASFTLNLQSVAAFVLRWWRCSFDTDIMLHILLL